MMATVLKDTTARLIAISSHGQSILVEAGAGSGKTAVMAGRIAKMLAEGVEPRSIAAITYTELAAGELITRVRGFVASLDAGAIPRELQIAFPDGLSPQQKANLNTASQRLDEVTCSTIHGFCQRLITPYPVEASIDPGASIIDRAQADLTFIEIVEAWLHESLSEGSTGLLAEMVFRDANGTVALVHKLIDNLREKRGISVVQHEPVGPLLSQFLDACGEYSAFVGATTIKEADTSEIAGAFLSLADELRGKANPKSAVDVLDVLLLTIDKTLVTEKNTFRAFSKKSKWAAAAKGQGYSKADGDNLFGVAEGHYHACCQSFEKVRNQACSWILSELVTLGSQAVAKFRDYKRDSAYLDFDDLIFSARDLLRDHDDVRRALSKRYKHLLVDEFQDTDPLQTEIVWRLCGDPVDGNNDWSTFQIRPGALFVVGDPKQAIYRFRGADVNAYARAKKLMATQEGNEVVSIATNFRSTAAILQFVNQQFATVLSEEFKQPGFTALDAFHPDHDGVVPVAALDVFVADENGKASVERQRDGEADVVAEFCARMIGSYQFPDRKTGEVRICQPGDIALLAPQGTELWRYEEALERRGIPVATQAGKGLFKRQEVQDLIALTRVLADSRDTLAFGALLRGPLVGLSDEEILDIIWGLPRAEDRPEQPGRLSARMSALDIEHPVARSVVERLQALSKRANSTSPHDLLSQAVDSMRVRSILVERHDGQAERALANVDLYLNLSRNYNVRGLRAFAEAMTEAWEDESKAVEGRPDAQEESVGLYTMHSAKGLEWNVVCLINTMTGQMGLDQVIVDREKNVLHCPIFKIKPAGYDEAHDAEEEQTMRERVRLWYVATTRAKELMILPRIDVAGTKKSWSSIVDLAIGDLPTFDVSSLPEPKRYQRSTASNQQTRKSFAAEGAIIAAKHRNITWQAPSRGELAAEDVVTAQMPHLFRADDDGIDEEVLPIAVQGGRGRGLVIHKLLEEVLNGEIADDQASLTARATVLLGQLGHVSNPDPAEGFNDQEIAGCVLRTLSIPAVAEIRGTLVPEFTVFGRSEDEDGEVLTIGIADCVSFDPTGQAKLVVDWKSDVDPSSDSVTTYTQQVLDYLEAHDLDAGLLVFVTSGQVVDIKRAA